MEQSTFPLFNDDTSNHIGRREREASRSAHLIVYSYTLFIGSLKSYKDFVVTVIVEFKACLSCVSLISTLGKVRFKQSADKILRE